jgi:cytochrome c oxidase assembly protein subunit 20
MTWAIGTFCVASAGMHEFCQQRRVLERKGMERASEIIERKRREREEKMERVRAERRKRKEEEDLRKEEEQRKKNGWKFW